MTKGKITGSGRIRKKKKISSNYRPITYLLMLWKILTTHEIYYQLKVEDKCWKNKIRCYKETRWMNDLQYIDYIILREVKTRRNMQPWYRQTESLLYGPANLDNGVSENVQNIRLSHTLYTGKPSKQDGAIDNGSTKSLLRWKSKTLSFKMTRSHHCYSFWSWYHLTTFLGSLEIFTKSKENTKVFAQNEKKKKLWWKQKEYAIRIKQYNLVFKMCKAHKKR